MHQHWFLAGGHFWSCSFWDCSLHLQWVSGKFGWNVKGTKLFGSFQQKISGSNGTSEKVVLMFVRFFFHFIKAIFDTSFRPSRSFFGKWKWFVQMVNAIPGRNSFTSAEVYVPFAQTVDQLVGHVNGRQPEYANHNLTNLVSVTLSPLFSIACIYG